MTVAATEKRDYLGRLGLRVPTSATVTGCGTTSRASTTGTRSDPTTRSGSSPGLITPARRHRLLDPPNFPGFDTVRTLCEILATGHDHSWFVLTQSIIEKEFALSGSEQNPNLDSQVMRPDGTAFRGRCAAGEGAGVGGGGVHGDNALEGSFLGGWIFSGRVAARSVARLLASGWPARAPAAPVRASPPAGGP